MSRKKKSIFWKVYCTVLIIVEIAAVIGLIWFSSWLKDYESSNRTHVVEDVIKQINDGQFLQIAAKTDVVGIGLEKAGDYAAEICKVFQGKNITYSKAFSYDRFTKPMYYIEADGEKVCKIALKKSGEKTKYGFVLYEVDYFTSFDFGHADLAFYIPDYYTAYVNGTELSADFVTKKVEDKDALKYAVTDKKDPEMLMYEVKGLLSDAVVQIKGPDGKLCDLSEEEGVYTASFLSLRFSIPAGYKVFVNGIELDENHISSSEGGESGVLLLGAGGEKIGFNTYKAEYLPEDSVWEIVAPDGSNPPYKINEDGTVSVSVDAYKVYAPSGLTVTVDGTVLTSDYITASDIEVKELSGILVKYLSDRPTNVEYSFACDTAPSSVTVSSADGSVTLSMDSNKTYTYDYTIYGGDRSALEEIAMKYTKNYSKFVTNDYDLGSFLSQILRDQPMYNELKDTPQYFYTGHAKYWFENEKVLNVHVYNDNCFSCEISYDHYIGDIKTDHSYQKCLKTHVEFWYVKYEGKWYMADWKIFNDM